MNTVTREFAPFFRNGKLFIPVGAVSLLRAAGLEEPAAHSALNGLDLGYQRPLIARIEQCLLKVLTMLDEDSAIFHVLSSEETRFLLSSALETDAA